MLAILCAIADVVNFLVTIINRIVRVSEVDNSIKRKKRDNSFPHCSPFPPEETTVAVGVLRYRVGVAQVDRRSLDTFAADMHDRYDDKGGRTRSVSRRRGCHAAATDSPPISAAAVATAVAVSSLKRVRRLCCRRTATFDIAA